MPWFPHSLLQRAHVPLCWSHLRKDVLGDDIGPQKPLLPPPISCGTYSRLSPFPNPEINFKSPFITFVPLPSTPQRTKTADLSCQICSWGSEYTKISPKSKCSKEQKLNLGSPLLLTVHNIPPVLCALIFVCKLFSI